VENLPSENKSDFQHILSCLNLNIDNGQTFYTTTGVLLQINGNLIVIEDNNVTVTLYWSHTIQAKFQMVEYWFLFIRKYKKFLQGMVFSLTLYSPVATGGLSPPNKAPSPPKLKHETI